MYSLSPHILVHDMNQTMDFYAALGFKVTMRFPEKGDKIAWTMMSKDQVVFIFQTFESFADELPMMKEQKGCSLILYKTKKYCIVL